MEIESTAPESSETRRKAKRPNILWICADQQRWDTVHCLGNERIRTPNLDRLAAEGVAFENAFCQSPSCTPSRASFLTGMYPSSVHACGNGNERWAEAAPLGTGTPNRSTPRLAGRRRPKPQPQKTCKLSRCTTSMYVRLPRTSAIWSERRPAIFSTCSEV